MGQLSGDFDGRQISSAGTPTVAAAQTSAGVSGVVIAGDDVAGIVTVTTGTTAAAGAQATVSFADAFSSAPKSVVVCRGDTVNDVVIVAANTVATNSWVLAFKTTPANGTTYKVQYRVNG